MFSKIKKPRNEGFTIIEVMIVLAIAALILLIVLLAVPALQRSSRNTQRKSDVGRISSATSEIISNNNGTISAATLTSAAITASVGTYGYYDFANTPASLAVSVLAAGGTTANPNSKDKVTVVGNGQCNGSNAQYAARAVAILYAVETSGGQTPICIDE